MKKEMLKDSIMSIIMMTVYYIGRCILISTFNPSGTTYEGLAGMVEFGYDMYTYRYVTFVCNAVGIALVVILIAIIIIDVLKSREETC